MHEIGIVRELVRTVTDFAAWHGVSQICEVRVDCGELSLVIPEYLEELFPVVAKDSILANAKLTIRMVPGLAECEGCDEIFNVIEHKGYCPNCGSFEKTILSGKEFSIREIVVPSESEET